MNSKLPGLVGMALWVSSMVLLGCGGGTGGTGGGTGGAGGGTGGAGGGTGGGTGGAGGGTGGAGDTTYAATLKGSNEIPAVTTVATGSATITLNAAQTSISYTVTHNVAAATSGHFHTGFSFESGSVAIALGTVASPITGTAAVSAQQVSDLKAGKIYLNIHSTAHVDGELRGQVLRTGEKLYRATMTGANEVPAVTTNATGALQVVLSSDSTKINCQGIYSGLTATGAHIHAGAASATGAVAFLVTFAGGVLGCATDTAVTAGDVATLNNNGFYANIHTAANANGEIRGQLLKP